MKRPKFDQIFVDPNEYCEKSSQIPVDTLVPGQSIKLSELIARFDRGQRLNVHANFPAGANFENITDEEAAQQIMTESLDDALFPPDNIHDVVDVEREYEQQQIHKSEFAEKMKKKRSKQAPPKEEALQDPIPDDPAK